MCRGEEVENIIIGEFVPCDPRCDWFPLHKVAYIQVGHQSDEVIIVDDEEGNVLIDNPQFPNALDFALGFSEVVVGNSPFFGECHFISLPRYCGHKGSDNVINPS